MLALRADAPRIGVDLASLSLEKVGGHGYDFVWPTPYSAYLAFSNAVAGQLVEAFTSSSLPEIILAASASVLGNIVGDAERAAKAALDLRFAEQRSIKLVFDPVASPVHAFIASSEPVPARKPNWADFYPSAPRAISLQDKLKTWLACTITTWNMRLMPTAGRADLHNQAPLLTEYMRASNVKPILIRLEGCKRIQAPHDMPHILDLTNAVGEIVERLLRAQNCKVTQVARVRFVVEGLALERLQTAYSTALCLKNAMPLHRIGDLLLGGTSNEIGRLLNWFYQKGGSKVWRFSHGGDRAFFFDPMWSVTEFPYVDHYHVFGAGEARQLTARYAANKRLAPFGGPPVFASFGSKRHQQWWRKGVARLGEKRAGKKTKIVICSGAYLGESIMVPLNFKQPDPLIIDALGNIISILVRGGFDVSVKPHPKGLPIGEKLYRRLGVETVGGEFDPTQMEADCYVFNFAGSAFFDALASEKSVVLIDSGVRQWDAKGLVDLKARCEIVEVRPDDSNRMRVNEEELISAVERASQRRGCPEWFAQKYFFSDDQPLY